MSLHLSHIWFSIEGHQLPFLQHAHTIFGWTCSILTNLVFWEMQERKSEYHHWLCSTFAFIMFNHQRKSLGNLESVKIYFWVVKHTLSSVVKIKLFDRHYMSLCVRQLEQLRAEGRSMAERVGRQLGDRDNAHAEKVAGIILIIITMNSSSSPSSAGRETTPMMRRSLTIVVSISKQEPIPGTMH